jgi:hypothetical protein
VTEPIDVAIDATPGRRPCARRVSSRTSAQRLGAYEEST